MKTVYLVALVAYTLLITDVLGKGGSKSGSKKGSKKGSKSGSRKDMPPCFDEETECTEKPPSSKGSGGPFEIWCKDFDDIDKAHEVCRNRDPKSGSAERYIPGRCGFCER